MVVRTPLTIPVVLTPEWVTRSWTTTAPRYDPHMGWELIVRVAGGEPLRAAITVGPYPPHRLARPRPGLPDNEIVLRLWGSTVTAPAAEQRKDAWLALGKRVPAATTWQLIELDQETTLMVFPRRDTTSRAKGRWIVRHDLQHLLPREFAVLQTV